MFNVFGFYKFKKLQSLKKKKYLLQKNLIKQNIRGTIILAKNVSTILKRVWNKVPTLAGIAIFFKSGPIGSLVKFNDLDNLSSVKFFLEYMLFS